MAIFAYTGLPGAGKSYETVRGPMLNAHKQGRQVWTNVPVTIPGAVVAAGPKASEHWYLDAPAGALVVIDECWRYWGAGATANEIPENIREWFAMHRHRTADGRSTDIVLICQDLSQVARFVRELVERTYRCYKLSALGTRKRYRVDAYDGAVSGQRPPKTQLIGSWYGKYSAEVWQYYSSHTQGGVATEVSPDTRGAVWKTPAVLAIPVALVLVPMILLNLDFVPGDTPTKPGAPVALDSSDGVVEPRPAAHDGGGAMSIERSEYDMPPPPTVAPDPGTSTTWTLVGVIQRPDGSGIALVRSTLGMRRLRIEDACRQQDADEWVCQVDGRDATGWTGAQWRTLARVDPL